MEGTILTIKETQLQQLTNQITHLTEQVATITTAEEKPMNIQEAAVFLSTKPKQVYHLIKFKGLPCHKMGKPLRFFKSELIEWLKYS
jgi:excisionase family DNA binding protein